MGNIEHTLPLTFEVCERSGWFPWECDLNACANGCPTQTVEYVPASYLKGAVRENGALRRALAAYRSALRSGEPETTQLRELGDSAFNHPGGQ